MGDSDGPGIFEVVLDATTSRCILHNTVTEEKRYLPEGRWDVHTHDDGAPFVGAETGASIWCDNLMDATCLQHPEKEGHWLVSCDGDVMSLEEYQQRHAPIVVPLVLPGRAEFVRCRAFALSQPVGGARVLWSISQLYADLVVGAAMT